MGQAKRTIQTVYGQLTALSIFLLETFQSKLIGFMWRWSFSQCLSVHTTTPLLHSLSGWWAAWGDSRLRRRVGCLAEESTPSLFSRFGSINLWNVSLTKLRNPIFCKFIQVYLIMFFCKQFSFTVCFLIYVVWFPLFIHLMCVITYYFLYKLAFILSNIIIY